MTVGTQSATAIRLWWLLAHTVLSRATVIGATLFMLGDSCQADARRKKKESTADLYGDFFAA